MTAPLTSRHIAADRRLAVVVLGVCVALATISLLVPATVTYDGWAWLTWGREIVHLDLDTTGGPSWKPLPVLLTTPLAVLGTWAPSVWLVLVRTAGLLAVVFAYRVARRLGGPVAGLLAAGLLVLTPDGGPRYLRLVMEGHSAPITAALVLGAVDRHLAGRSSQTLVLLTLLALDRPEAWLFLLAYGAWSWVRAPEHRPLVLLCFSVVPVLWFGADWWGSGSPFQGADTAKVLADDAVSAGAALERAWRSVISPVWLAAGVALVLWAVPAVRSRLRSAPGRPAVGPVVWVLVSAAVVWDVVVIATSLAFDFAAIARFFLPSAALLVVVAAVGVVHGIELVPGGWRRALVITAVVLCSAPAVVGRASHLGELFQKVEERAIVSDDLAAAIRAAGGPGALQACGPVTTDAGLSRTDLAWRIDLPLRGVLRVPQAPSGAVVVRADGTAVESLQAAGPRVERLARHGGWVVYAVDCSSPR